MIRMSKHKNIGTYFLSSSHERCRFPAFPAFPMFPTVVATVEWVPVGLVELEDIVLGPAGWGEEVAANNMSSTCEYSALDSLRGWLGAIMVAVSTAMETSHFQLPPSR